MLTDRCFTLRGPHRQSPIATAAHASGRTKPGATSFQRLHARRGAACGVQSRRAMREVESWGMLGQPYLAYKSHPVCADPLSPRRHGDALQNGAPPRNVPTHQAGRGRAGAATHDGKSASHGVRTPEPGCPVGRAESRQPPALVAGALAMQRACLARELHMANASERQLLFDWKIRDILACRTWPCIQCAHTFQRPASQWGARDRLPW